MTNKNKIINQAQKFIQKGQWDKAIKELQKLVAEDPNDVRTLLKLGDVYAKKGEREQATKVYKQVAESYSEQGFFLKAVAVYKQILKHDPKHLEVTLKLAELYEHLGLTSEAMAQYQIASQIHDESGHSKDALDVLKRMVELDADNVASRIKLAEGYSRENRTEEAIEEFQRAADILKRQGRIDDYIKVAERLVYHDPNRLDVIKELAHIYLKKNDTKRGLAKLQLCFKAEPRDIETLTLLAGAFRDLGQIQKTIFVYRELARIHQENRNDLEARTVLQKILEVDPNDAEARALLGVRTPSGPQPAGFGAVGGSGPMSQPYGGVPIAQGYPMSPPAQEPQAAYGAPNTYGQFGGPTGPGAQAQFGAQPALGPQAQFGAQPALGAQPQFGGPSSPTPFGGPTGPGFSPAPRELSTTFAGGPAPGQPYAAPQGAFAAQPSFAPQGAFAPQGGFGPQTAQGGSFAPQTPLPRAPSLSPRPAMPQPSAFAGPTPAPGGDNGTSGPMAPSLAPAPRGPSLAPRPAYGQRATPQRAAEPQRVAAPQPQRAPEPQPAAAEEVPELEGEFRDVQSDEVLYLDAVREAERSTAARASTFSASPQPASARAASERAKTDGVAIGKILTETDVYIKYGLRDKALEHLRKIFELDPDNVLAYAKMRDIYLAAGDTARAAETVANIVHIHSKLGDADALETARQELAQLAPGHPLIAGAGQGWSFRPPTEEIDSIDITEDSDVFDLGDAAAEIRGEAPEQDALGAWLEDDPGAAVAGDEASDGGELTPQGHDTGSFATGEEPQTFGLLEADEGASAVRAGRGAPSARGEPSFAQYPQFDSGPGGMFEESSSVAIGDSDIVDSEAIENGEERFDDPAGATRIAEYPAFEDGQFDVERTDTGAVPAMTGPHRVMDVHGAVHEAADTSDLEAALAEAVRAANEDELPEATSSEVVSLEELGGSTDAFTAMSDDVEDGDLADRLEHEDTPPPGREAAGDGDDGADDQQTEDDLDEIEFLLGQGLTEEAEELLQTVLERRPDHPRAIELRARFAERAGEAGGEAPEVEDEVERAAPPRHDTRANGTAHTELELAGEPTPLAAEPGVDGPGDVSDDDVGQAFEAATADAGEENPEDHYDHGIAYKEVGRLDDAIAHFLIAARAPSREIAALEMIGHCLVAKGDHENAIQYFWTALERGPEPSAATNLKYEIGATYEAAGDAAQAVAWFQACWTDDPEHRDVRHRLAALGADPELDREAMAGTNGAYGAPVEDDAQKASKKNKISYI